MSAEKPPGSEGKSSDQREPGAEAATGKKPDLKILKSLVSDPHAHAEKMVDKVYWESLDIAYKLIFDTAPYEDEDPWPFNEKADVGKATIEVPPKGAQGNPRGPFTVRNNARKKLVNGKWVGYGYKVDPPHPTRPVPEIIPDP